jgi:hypothetical protein
MQPVDGTRLWCCRAKTAARGGRPQAGLEGVQKVVTTSSTGVSRDGAGTPGQWSSLASLASHSVTKSDARPVAVTGSVGQRRDPPCRRPAPRPALRGRPTNRADRPRRANEALAKLPKHQRPALLPEGLRFYDLRHTCASLLIAQGASVKAVQAQFGHATASITLDTYGHLFPSEMEALADRLELVRDAAVARRSRTRRGPTEDDVGKSAGR